MSCVQPFGVKELFWYYQSSASYISQRFQIVNLFNEWYSALFFERPHCDVVVCKITRKFLYFIIGGRPVPPSPLGAPRVFVTLFKNALDRGELVISYR